MYNRDVTERGARGLRRGLLSVTWIAFVVGLVMLLSYVPSCESFRLFHCDNPCHDGECCDHESKRDPLDGTIAISLVVNGFVSMFARALVPNPDKKPRRDQGST